jgi:2-methylcitrate dehydratase
VERLGAFASTASFDQLSEAAAKALKLRVLDSLGTALGALGAEPVARVRRQVEDFGGAPHCSLIGGGRSAPDRAALLNGALGRYLDFNDAYLAPGETCHPSDNVAPVLAACEYARATGRDFLTALAVAYQVQCRLSDDAPVRAQGFDHVTQGAYAVAPDVSRALGLDPGRAAHAIAIAGTSLNALRVTRTGELSNWKGWPIRRPRSAPPTRPSSRPPASRGRARCSRATRASWTPSPGGSISTGSARISRR